MLERIVQRPKQSSEHHVKLAKVASIRTDQIQKSEFAPTKKNDLIELLLHL